MEQVLARARIYFIIFVFFVSCFLGLNAKVSLPTLAIRSIIIAGITGIISHFLLKYLTGVFVTALQKERKEGGVGQPQMGEGEMNNNGENDSGVST